MPVSKANQRAVNKYKKNNYDRMEVFVAKGRKDVVKAHASALGESVNGFICRAISETMERDSSGPPSTSPSEAPQAPPGAGVVSVSLPPDALARKMEGGEQSGN